MADQLQLNPNVPEVVAIKYPTPRVFKSQFEGSPDRAMFSLVDGRVLYVPVPVATEIEQLQLGTREPFSICKYVKGKETRIIVSLTPEGEIARAIQEADGPIALRNSPVGAGNLEKSTAPVVMAASVKPPDNGNGSSNGHSNGTPQNPHVVITDGRPRTRLEDALKTVVAAIHSTNEYAKTIGYAMPQFTSEDLRTMANTIMIQNGGK